MQSVRVKARTTKTVSAQFYTHKMLWIAARLHHDAGARDLGMYPYLYLSSQILCYFTFEAYLNFLGERLFPETWAKEQEVFSEDPYRGTLGKFDFISERIGFSAEKGKRPYQTLKTLHDLRKQVVHGRTEKFVQQVSVKKADMYPHFEIPHVSSKLEDLLTEANSKRAVEDTREIIEAMHDSAKSSLPQKKLEPRPLDNQMGKQSIY
jgi:hypothetical protein